MEPAEFIDLVIAARDGIGGNVSNFVTALFAYLVMAYFVADRLSKPQVWGISLIYSAYVFLPAVTAFQDIQTLGALMTQFHAQHPEEAAIYTPHSQAYPLGWALVAAISWVLSIWFMLQQRSKKGGEGDA